MPSQAVNEAVGSDSTASGTSHSGVAVIEVVVLGSFGNFQFGF
jgi:hypothetical protein